MNNDKLIPYLSYSPGWLLSDSDREYVPAANTDLLASFERMGWVPPSKKRKTNSKADLAKDYVKWYDIGYNDALDYIEGRSKHES